MSEQKTTDMSQHFYRAAAADFMRIPTSPIAYWVKDKVREAFSLGTPLLKLARPCQGMATTNNNLFLRSWYEVSAHNSSFGLESPEKALKSECKWFPYNKGGDYRKWYGNAQHIVNYEKNGAAICNYIDNTPGARVNSKGRVINRDKYFKESISWSKISSGFIALRYYPQGFIFDVAGCSIFANKKDLEIYIGFLNSYACRSILSAISPTLNFEVGHINSLPILPSIKDQFSVQINTLVSKLITLTKNDWDSYETSWDFTLLPLLANDIKQSTISHNYTKLREQWLTDTQEMQSLEEENNRIFIDAYGLQDELTPEVLLNEITLTCNPHYRYRGDLTEQEREDRLQSDTIAELISYAIGCMMGRYSLDREGLVYAHAGNEGFADLVAEGAYKTFAADDDGILPLTEQEWFSDDVTNRISEFVRTVWGEQHLEENLQFIADSLCLYALKAKKGERALDTIRRYLSNQFYKDHLKTYKRRPIYWLFSSGKHKAFECLIYLHRYHEGTLARMRTEYVIPLSSRINARINRLQEEAEAASSTSERKQLMAELKTLQNQQAELSSFDEQLRHHADQRISLDLDDGVKENYGKFGNLLSAVKDVTGKAAD